MSTLKPVRHLVAANDGAGRSTVQFDGAAPNSHPAWMSSASGHTDLWVWNDSPMRLSGTHDDGNPGYAFPGLPRGRHLCVVQNAGRPAGPASDPERLAPHEPHHGVH